MDLTALVQHHDQEAAKVAPVVYALLRAVRYLQDGRQFVEGDFREWMEAGARLHGAPLPAPVATPTPVVPADTTAAQRMAKARAAKAAQAAQRST